MTSTRVQRSGTDERDGIIRMAARLGLENPFRFEPPPLPARVIESALQTSKTREQQRIALNKLMRRGSGRTTYAVLTALRAVERGDMARIQCITDGVARHVSRVVRDYSARLGLDHNRVTYCMHRDGNVGFAGFVGETVYDDSD